ncbi:hypothetical protein CHLRE_08g369100v5 [Chlamydomonas reinhardtii]|uniref:Uncharacterized protein n=1 Tax=Chlamydomonas reinhardtii TaxID=3055 RepID=A0A2K3DH60_CHLRE|nr:uncharacterized protein CHLRE_08g369100v5 [Chlamydomonas reinhardtii]PNW79847.1 hypothetical protein CHLRE_08g369100v5 [Chlamydomonas reinhardtii]
MCLPILVKSLEHAKQRAKQQQVIVDCGLRNRPAPSGEENPVLLVQLCALLCTAPAGGVKPYRPESRFMRGSPKAADAEGGVVDPLFLEGLRRTLLRKADKPAAATARPAAIPVKVLVTVF